MRLRLSGRALVTPVSTAVMIWSSQRRDGRCERGQFGDLLVLRAPVVEGEEPVADLPLARDRSGDALAQVQRVAELFLADPGKGDVLARPGGVEGLDDLAELFW